MEMGYSFLSYFLLDISRKEGIGNREQGTVIDNLWIIIDFIFDFWRSLRYSQVLNSYLSVFSSIYCLFIQ